MVSSTIFNRAEGTKVLKMEHFELIRRMVEVEGLSRREVARRLGHSRKTIEKALQNAAPLPYTLSQPRRRPKLQSFTGLIQAWLKSDETAPRKQRHTATRIYERLRDEHEFVGSRRAVSDLVRDLRAQHNPVDVFCPIEHPVGGEIQIDWGEATAIFNSQPTKVMIFCARLAYSKATFVRAYHRDDLVSFLDAHVWMLEQLGGVPKCLAYDNLKSAVIKVYPGHNRDLNRRFAEMRSHYLFETRFCNVASGNEKGHVENSVKRMQRSFMTPVPQVASIDELNEHLTACCRRDLNRIDAATGRSYGEMYLQEKATFRPLPQVPFSASTSQPCRVDRRSTVPSERSRYSVPISFACKPVVVRSFVDRIEVIHQDQIVARHKRAEPGEWLLELEHYLPLLDRKPGLLSSGKPFRESQWNANQQLFRRELEFRLGSDGTRQFINVVLLAKQYAWKDVCKAIDACVAYRAFDEQAVRLELQRQTDKQSTQLPLPGLDLDHRPELRQTSNGCRDLNCYDQLMLRHINGDELIDDAFESVIERAGNSQSSMAAVGS